MTSDDPGVSVPAAFHDALAALPEEVVIIAWWESDESHEITIQDFNKDGLSYIPIFTSAAEFDSQVAGSGYEASGVMINSRLLLSLMKGGETLMINPGTPAPRPILLPPLDQQS